MNQKISLNGMKQKFQNPTLRASIKELTISTASHYNNFFENPATPRDGGAQTFIALTQQLEPILQNTPGFNECIKIIESDKAIQALLGQSVGYFSSTARMGDASFILLSFLAEFHRKNPEFSITEFDRSYAAFEEFFYSNKIRLADTVKLFNFDMAVDELRLDIGLIIAKTSFREESDNEIVNQYRYHPYTMFHQSRFVIIREYSVEKIVGEIEVKDREKALRQLEKSPEAFDLVIKALRLLKSSGIYRDKTISTESLTFSPLGGIISHHSTLADNITFGEICHISEGEVKELQSIFRKLQKTDHPQFRIALNRLSYGLEKARDEDRLIDYMIGLEALYLPGASGELTKQLSLRVAFMLENSGVNRKECFIFMNEMYSLRSKIVHGDKKEPIIKTEDITRMEAILRRSLKAFLDNSGRFDTESLQNIYF